MAKEAWLKSTIDGRRLVLAAAGNWTALHAREIEPLVDAAVPDKTKFEQVDIDLARVEHIDTFGAWLVERMRRSATAAGLKTAIVGLDSRFKVLFDEIAASNKKDAWRPRHEKPIVVSLMHIGKSVLATRDDFVDMINFLGVLTVAFARVAVKPWKFRFTSIVHQIDIVGFPRGADHRADQLPDRRDPGAAGHFPFPQVRRREFRRRHGRHSDACAKSAC